MDCKEFIRITKEYDGDICIFGAGDYGSTWCYALLKDAELKIVCYIDNYKAGTICNGLPVYPLDHIKQHGELFVFVSTRGEAEVEMVEQLESIGVKKYYHFDSDYAPVDFAQYLDTLGDEELISRFPSVMDDEEYLKIRFKYRMGYELDLEHPKTFNEKLNWLKIHDRNPIYTTMADKYAVKDYVGRKIGFEHVVPLYGVWERFEDIDFEKLPAQFVLKCTHDSGGMVICKNKDEFDFEHARNVLESCLRVNTFWGDREWPYKNVKPRIIAEKYIDSLGKPDSIEYKITVINGQVEFVTICRGIAHASFDVRTNDHFDMNFKRVNFYAFYKNSNINYTKPDEWNEFIAYAEILAKGLPQLRVDFYVDNGIVYFGEITFFTWSGCIKFVPSDYDNILGDKLILPPLEQAGD